MPRNSLEDLRNHLFETLENLNDPDSPVDVHHAKAVAGVAREINATAKNEISMIKMLQDAGYRLDKTSSLLPAATKEIQ